MGLLRNRHLPVLSSLNRLRPKPGSLLLMEQKEDERSLKLWWLRMVGTIFAKSFRVLYFPDIGLRCYRHKAPAGLGGLIAGTRQPALSQGLQMGFHCAEKLRFLVHSCQQILSTFRMVCCDFYNSFPLILAASLYTRMDLERRPLLRIA